MILQEINNIWSNHNIVLKFKLRLETQSTWLWETLPVEVTVQIGRGAKCKANLKLWTQIHYSLPKL